MTRLLPLAALAMLLTGCPSKVNTPPAPEEKLLAGTPAETMSDAQKEGATYLLRDTGKRCIVAPCPSWAAVDVKTRAEREITGVDLSALQLDAKGESAARERVLSGQVWARGEIRTVPKQGPAGDGTVLFVGALVEADAK